MDIKVVIICSLVALLGVISAGTGFAAEVTRVKASQIEIYYQCIYPSSPATVLGIISAGTLLIAQIIINFATGCFCCVRRTGQSHLTKALCFYIISWITFLVAMGLLLAGARLNAGDADVVFRDGYSYCYYIRPGVFAAGAVLAALCSIFGVFYYQTLNTKRNDAINAPVTNQGGIAMAQPQFPSENPGFVHGDAYDKPQFS